MGTTLNSNVQSIIKDSREKIIASVKKLVSDLGDIFYFQDESINISIPIQTGDGSMSQCRLKRLEIEDDSVILVYSDPNNSEKDIKDRAGLLSIQELISLVDSIQLSLICKQINLFSTNITILLK